MPKNSKKLKKGKYYLYEAAFHGCLPCVRFSLQEKGVHPAAGSDTQGYTAVDWATWAITLHGKDEAPTKSNVQWCKHVLEFLKNEAALSPCPDPTSLDANSNAHDLALFCVLGNGHVRPKITPPNSLIAIPNYVFIYNIWFIADISSLCIRLLNLLHFSFWLP